MRAAGEPNRGGAVWIGGLHHLVLYCRDAEAARWWYEKVGFEHLRTDNDEHWFRLGTAEILLHPARRSSGPGGPAVHVAVSDVDALFRLVLDRGLVPVDHEEGDRPMEAPVTRPWGDREFELQDPEGHRWIFTQA